jgi:poly(3-hydroxybutyrate) depolymerase
MPAGHSIAHRRFTLAFEPVITWGESNFCVDTTRRVSTGMGYGGIMSETIPCQMPDVFRAIITARDMISSDHGCSGEGYAIPSFAGTAIAQVSSRGSSWPYRIESRRRALAPFGLHLR